MEPKRPQTQEVQESFRSSLEDCATIVQALAKCCATPEEMLEMVRLAASNDGQLRLLMELTKAQGKR